ncbi:MAG: HEAT repeat domain-containing protein [Gemmataceae bacterium]|nr:HEAT repeat domain-containing protein [Gemmata sp.]MDW8198054.1 HEAT repeat domain-containing protein [Gemmataceae bacterium]
MDRWIAVLLVAIAPASALAQRDAKVPDPDPELERKTFILPEGFEVNLYAADPMLAKPIQMNWDARGRLWVASSEVYPQIQPGQKANDKILILEDTTGDGQADKVTVFADGLLIPTGVEPGDGGAYVANSTELIHLSARQPGGRADTTRVLLSGFGTEDTHHIIHTFRWGPDSRLYFNQSIYIHSHVETPYGVKRLNAGGIWRFNPGRTELDIFARGWINSWGHAFDQYGQSFVTDGAGGEGIHHAIPGGYYLTSEGPHKQRVLHGMNPGSPKYCGLEIISGRHFPADWQGDCITCDFRGHRVCRFKLADDGSTFASREMTEVIKSNHPAFRPVDVKMGPDGALYIADWYNPIIQHGEVDFRDPRRDKTHGRIWRVTAKNRPLVEKPKLADATIPELLEQLKAPEQWTRQQAKRVLKERGGPAVLEPVARWVAGLDPNDPAYHQWLLEAAWVVAGCDTLRGAELPTLLKATNPNIRAAAVRLLFYFPKDLPETLQTLAARVVDDHPRVRLEAIRALSVQTSPEAVAIALQALEKPLDRTLDYALWLTVRELEPYWLPEFQAGRLTFGGNVKKIAFALQAIGDKGTIRPVLTLLESGQLPPENVHAMWRLLTQIGGTAELVKVLDDVAHRIDRPVAQRAELVQAVEDAIRNRKIPAPKQVDSLGWLATDKVPAIRHPALRIIGLWKSAAHRDIVETLATRDTLPAAERSAALEALALYGDAAAKATISRLCEANQPDEICRVAIMALAGLDLAAAIDHAGRFFGYTQPHPDLEKVFTALISRKGGPALLAKAITGSRFHHSDVAKIGLKAVRASGQPAEALVAALTKAGGLDAPRKPPTEVEVKALAATALRAGNAVRGEAVYRRKELQCLACHAIAGAGGVVGPDLSSIGASAPADYLVEALLLPSKAVKEGYHALRIVTADEKVIQGIKVRETNGVLVLRTADDQEVAIAVNDIVERTQATKSLMPEGLTESLTQQEFADLVKFLAELGKVDGPYPPSTARLVRRWQYIEPTAANTNLFRRTRVAAAAEVENPFSWSPVYSTVAGVLPLAELPSFTVWKDTAAQSVVRFQLDVSTGGTIKLKFNSTKGLSVYLGRTPREVQAETVLDVPAGLQTVTILIDRAQRTEDLRIELADVAGSPARVRVVGGK